MNRLTYHVIKTIIKTCTIKPKMHGEHHIIDGHPSMFMSNHARFYGPIVAACFFPKADKTWANFEVIDTDICKEYTTRTLFKETLGWNDKPAQFVGNIVGGLLAGLMQNEPLIPAYWEPQRARESIMYGVNAALEGSNQMMFARNVYNNDMPLGDSFDFFKGYQMVLHQLIKKHDIAANVYPVAINRFNRTLAIGPHTAIQPELPVKEEIARIHHYLVEAVKLGYSTPEALAELKYAENL